MTPHWRSSNLQAWYGESHILHGVSLSVQPGEVVTCWAATAPAAPPRCARSWA
jgi:ABC-type polar amino acid transport system ATPase subunit